MTGLRRLLCIDQFGEPGGGQNILGDLAAGAQEQGVEVHVALPDGTFAEHLRERGATVHRLDLPELSWHRKTGGDAVRFASSVPRLARELRRIAREVEPDLLHVNGGRLLLPAALARTGRPLTFHAHSAYADAPTRRSMAWALRVSDCAAVITPSPFMRHWAHVSLGVPPERLAMVWNWVDDKFFDLPGPRARTDGEPLKIVLLGRITPVKGQDIALAAYKRLPTGLRERCRLEILGPADNEAAAGPFLERLRSESADDDDITVRDGFADAFEVFKAADVCLVPSCVDETFGLVAAEAMASSVAVIVSNRGALPQVVGPAGVVCPQEGAQALGAALRRLLIDQPLRDGLIRAGRSRAEHHFRREKQVHRVLLRLRQATEDSANSCGHQGSGQADDSCAAAAGDAGPGCPGRSHPAASSEDS